MVKKVDYTDGGEGFIQWVDDNVCLPVYPPGSKISRWVPVSNLPKAPDPDTGRSYHTFWEEQKEVMREALQMEGGRFIYRLIVLCWMRGEGKTYLNCLFQMWRFFNWPKQVIVLCANSKEQTDFISFTTIKDIIVNSPKLRKLIGPRNIQKKLIRIKDNKGNVVSIILSVSSFSGIFSNITGYSFTEIHEMKNPEFFQQVHGSIRNIPNAMGFIDSTVSPKDHILYRQYEAFVSRKDPTIFFSYRQSRKAEYTDYWHPLNTQVQLESYRTTFLPGAFDRYFKNLWTVGADKVFEPHLIDAINYLGASKTTSNQWRVFELLKRRHKILDMQEDMKRKNIEYESAARELALIEDELWPVDDEYVLHDANGNSSLMSVEMLERMSRLYDTDWAVTCGIDRAQPMKLRTSARTIFNAVAKGLPGSRSDPNLGTIGVPNYIYLLLYLIPILDHSVEGLKAEILRVNDEYDGIDKISSETWGIFDMKSWCEDNAIDLDMITATYPKQLAAFTEMYQIISTGRFKAANVHVVGSKGGDILREELSMFDHDEETKWFGSPEKRRKYGVQDDVVYSLGLNIYGSRLITFDHFRPRTGGAYFGEMTGGGGLVGRY